MRLFVDQPDYRYTGYHRCESVCSLRIYSDGLCERAVVVLTELDSNPGTSVTNVSEALASRVWYTLLRPYARVIWVEHYPGKRVPEGARPSLYSEHFDAVTYTVGNWRDFER